MTPNELDNAIDNAFDADRTAIPADDPAARARLISMLGTAAPAGISGASGTTGSGLLSAGIAKILMIVVTALGLAGGAYLLVPASPEPSPRSPVDAQKAPVRTPAVIAPGVVSSPSISEPVTARRGDSVAFVARESTEKSSRVQEPAPIEHAAAVEKPTSAPPKARDSVKIAEPVVVTKDSVRVEVNVNMDGLK